MQRPKTHQDYWTSRLKKRAFSGQEGEWQVYIQHLRRREWFSLGTNNKVFAAKRATEIYQSLKLQGWETTITKYKGEKYVKKEDCTLGDFFKAAKDAANISPGTFITYCRCLRLLISHLRNIPDSPKKFDYKTGGADAWRKKIDSTPLSFLTPEKIRKWQKEYLAKAGSDPLQIRHAEHSANKIIRNAKSLFSKNLLPLITEVPIPSPHPFEGITYVKSGSMRYRSEINPVELVQQAKDELYEQYPEQYKIFLLSLYAGLRRNEIDKLLWTSIDWKNENIHIEPTEYFSPKTESSIGKVPLSPAIVQVLKDFHKGAKGKFVIESRVSARPNAAHPHYRANGHFKKLTTWLRGKDIDTPSPIHTLRKEYGRLITENYGIYAASKALRHAGIQITAAHYADDKRRIVVEI